MSNAFLYRMPAGIPGDITRHESATVEPIQIDSANPPTAYGVPCVIDDATRKLRKVKTGDIAADIYGFLVRPYPTGGSQDGLGKSTPPTAGMVDALRRGYLAVINKSGSAAKGGPVYVRVVAASGKAVGDIEAGADGTNNVAIPATFVGAADADGITEIAYNI